MDALVELVYEQFDVVDLNRPERADGALGMSAEAGEVGVFVAAS